MTKHYLLFLACVLQSIIAYTQITFEKTYGATGLNMAYSVAQTHDEGYIIAGITNVSAVGTTDVYLIRTDLNGDTLWTKNYGKIGVSSVANSVKQLSDGGFIVSGYTDNIKQGGICSVYLIRTDENGDSLWTSTITGHFDEFGYRLAESTDDGYLVVGRKGSKICLIKTDLNGNPLWTSLYGGSVGQYGYSVATTIDGGYIVAGSTNSFGEGSYDVYLIRTDATGDTLWTSTFGGADVDFGYSVVQTADGGFVVAGGTESFGSGSFDVYVIRTDSTGDALWTKTFGGAENDLGYSVTQSADGGIIVAGKTNSFGAGSDDVFLIKTNENGDLEWYRTFGGAGFDIGRSVAQTSDGGIVIAGSTNSFGVNWRAAYLIKTDADGILVSTNESGSLHAKEELKIFPNPTKGSMNIQVTQTFGKVKTLEIMDRTGRAVMSQTGDFANIDMGALTRGLYVVVLTNFDNEKRMMKIIKE